MEHHQFNYVKLTDEEVQPFTGGLKEMLERDEEEKDKWLLLSLKYFMPAIPKKPNEKPKPLSNDEKLQNQYFLVQCRKFWKKAQEELKNRLIEEMNKADLARAEALKKSANKLRESKDVEFVSPAERAAAAQQANERFMLNAERNALMALSLARYAV